MRPALLLLLACLPVPPAFAQTTLTLREGENGYRHAGALIRADSTSQNSGARDQLIVGKTSGAVRTVLSFGLSAIPAGSTITEASLSLWTDPQSSTALGTVGVLELHRLGGTPVEGTGTTAGGAGTGVTWISRDGQTGSGHSWTTPGGDYEAAVLASVPGFNTLTPNVQKTFGSTPLLVAALQSALDQGLPLDLLVMAPTTESGANNIYTRLCADDSATTHQRPLLTVTFNAPGLAAPTALTAIVTTWSRATLTWNAPAGSPAGYVIERRADPAGEWTTVIITSPGTTTIEDTGLDPETTYTWRIKALYADGESVGLTSAALTTPAAVARPPLVVLPLGDSITRGTLAGGYRAPLYTAFADAGYTIRFVGSQTTSSTAVLTDSGNEHHEGHGGYTIQQIIDNLDGGTSNGGHWLDGIAGTRDPVYPDVILLMIGTNDLGVQQREVAETLVAYDQLLTKLHTLRPTALIVASTLIPYTGTTYPDREQHQVEFNAALPALIARRRAAGQRITLHDMRAQVFAGHIGSDGVHPNQSGYDALAAGWFEAFTVLPLMENWRRAHFGTAANAGDAADLADPDGDGEGNLCEYAFGTDPNDAGSRPFTQVGIATGAEGDSLLQITFRRRRNHDLGYRVQSASELAAPADWRDAGVQVDGPHALDDEFEQVTYRDPASLAGAARRFLRVQVTPP